MERETIKRIVTMKEYPYISIILLEFWFNMREDLLKEDMFVITGVSFRCFSSDHDRVGVYGVRFMKESWSGGERMLDLPINYYKRRLRHYKSIEREIKLKELGI